MVPHTSDRGRSRATRGGGRPEHSFGTGADELDGPLWLFFVLTGNPPRRPGTLSLPVRSRARAPDSVVRRLHLPPGGAPRRRRVPPTTTKSFAVAEPAPAVDPARLPRAPRPAAGRNVT